MARGSRALTVRPTSFDRNADAREARPVLPRRFRASAAEGEREMAVQRRGGKSARVRKTTGTSRSGRSAAGQRRSEPAGPADLTAAARLGVDPETLRALSLRRETNETGARAARGTDQLSNAEVHRSLLDGSDADLLSTYFGPAEYEELRRLAARASERTRRGGPRVLILPGILGSMLAKVGLFNDTIWIDFIDIAAGRLRELKLPAGAKSVRATDVWLLTYARLYWTLRLAGFDVDYHPYDWRRSIPQLGAELARRIERERAREVFLVGHSMGGLVARAAMHIGAPKVRRSIMLGTPNFGSFAPALVLRGAYRLLKYVSFIDGRHDARVLAQDVFSTFPGLAEMLPHRSKFSALDLYDARAWPAHGPKPNREVLAAAPAAQQKMAVDPERMINIAGVDQPTVTGLRVSNGEFAFTESQLGDETVPYEFVVLPSIPTYHVVEKHGKLPSNGAVIEAVIDLIRTGTTRQLPDRWTPRAQRAAAGEVSESELHRRLDAELAGSQTRPEDLRALIREFAAPPATSMVSAEPELDAAASVPLDSLIIGRKRQRTIAIRLAQGSITRVKTRAIVIGIFRNVLPAGPALALDALMDGAITELCQRRMFAGQAGEVFILPAGRNALRADFVVFAGLGDFQRFNERVLESVMENLARTLVRTDIEEIATVAMGSTSLPLTRSLKSVCAGFLRGLADADPDHNFRRITLCELDPARYLELRRTCYELPSSTAFDSVELTLSEITLPPDGLVEGPLRGATGSSQPLLYLTVTAQLLESELRFTADLLTSGSKSTVLRSERKLQAKKLAAHLAEIETEAFTAQRLGPFGAALGKLVLDARVLEAIEQFRDHHLVVIHDREAARVPWETLCVSGHRPALGAGLSRRYIAADMSVARWTEQRRAAPELEVLLVVNPLEDLEGAEREGDRVLKLLASHPDITVSCVRGREVTQARLKQELASGRYDVVHYAGHASFDAKWPGRAGLVCSDGVLGGPDLIELGNMPALVILNACESARIRRLLSASEKKRVPGDIATRMARSVSVAEALLRGGVANFVGTYWPVGDSEAEVFATTLYPALLAGSTLHESVHKARLAVESPGKSVDWADYLLYGGLDFRVKTRDR